jgi:hypothetical protein
MAKPVIRSMPGSSKRRPSWFEAPVVNECKNGVRFPCPERATVPILAPDCVAGEKDVPDSGEQLRRLAADMVTAARAYAHAARAGADTSDVREVLGGRLMALAEEFYLTEDLCAMEICFHPAGEASECREPLPGDRNGAVHLLVAKFIASLPPRAEAAVRADPFLGGGLDSLSRALN